ncbi:MAG: hypothetical protein LBC99_05210 [Spirochaetota bacterium]|jgi:uncharacterized protein YacL|nr:hypothetical protein [Spirochaetota bacterium]
MQNRVRDALLLVFIIAGMIVYSLLMDITQLNDVSFLKTEPPSRLPVVLFFTGLALLAWGTALVLLRIGAKRVIFVLAGILLGRVISVFAFMLFVPQTNLYWGIFFDIFFIACGIFFAIRLSRLFVPCDKFPFLELSSARRGVIQTKPKIVDTSVVIDGRIADVIDSGFMEGSFIVPEFVLTELQQIADSADAIKRSRGRRGLGILTRMKSSPNCIVTITDADFPGITEVDAKLVELAIRTNAMLITNDFNLNKVAALRGIRVLNINELANVLKTNVLPGEEMSVTVIKEGKDPNQGIAYLDDGTMIVVDKGRGFINQRIPVMVTSVFQTPAGRMIFAHPVK